MKCLILIIVVVIPPPGVMPPVGIIIGIIPLWIRRDSIVIFFLFPELEFFYFKKGIGIIHLTYFS